MKYINKTVDIDSACYTVAVTSSYKPLTIYVNQENNSAFGAYIYSINSQNEVYSTILQNHENYEIVKSVNTLLVKKYQRPIYLNVNGYIETSYGLLHCLIEIIDSLLA